MKKGHWTDKSGVDIPRGGGYFFQKVSVKRGWCREVVGRVFCGGKSGRFERSVQRCGKDCGDAGK